MNLADVCGIPTKFITPVGELLASPPPLRRLGVVQAWLDNRGRPAGWSAPAAPMMTRDDLFRPPPPGLGVEERRARARAKVRILRGEPADDGWPLDLYDVRAYRLIAADADGMALVLSAALHRHHRRLADDHGALLELLDHLTPGDFAGIFAVALDLIARPGAARPARPAPAALFPRRRDWADLLLFALRLYPGLSYETALDLPVSIWWKMLGESPPGSLCEGMDRLAGLKGAS